MIMACLNMSTRLLAQEVDLSQLRTLREELKASKKEKAKQIDSLDLKLDSLKKEIEILSGWLTGFSGVLGFDFSESGHWMANQNPNSSTSALAISFNSYANLIRKKGFWRNSAIISLGWQSLDTDTDDDVRSPFLNERNTDLMQLSSLYGYRLSPTLATSILADLNTSVFSFLAPGSLDFGLGATWTPKRPDNLAAVLNPLTLHFIFSDREEVENTSQIGLKAKITYQYKFSFGLKWGSTLTAFIPYRGADEGQPDLMEYTWINALSINLWKGLGVGFNIGIRQADFETEAVQWHQNLGISYAF